MTGSPRHPQNTFFFKQLQQSIPTRFISSPFSYASKYRFKKVLPQSSFSLFLKCAFILVGNFMDSPLVSSSSKREGCLHSGKSWKLLSPTFLAWALAKAPDVQNKRPYLLTAVLVKAPEGRQAWIRHGFPRSAVGRLIFWRAVSLHMLY